MVRKITIFMIVCILACAGFTCTASAYTHEVYDGNMSSTYVNYFKDIVSNIPINDNYVCFRSGENEYLMIVGDIDYDTGVFTLKGVGTKFTVKTVGQNYSNRYSYNVVDINNFQINAYDYILYSDLGQYPQLLEKGVEYEFQILFILIVIGLCAFLRSVFSFTYRTRNRE